MPQNNNNPANQAKSEIRLIYGAAIAICLIFMIVGIYAWHRIEVRAEADLIAALAEEITLKEVVSIAKGVECDAIYFLRGAKEEDS